MNHFDGVDLYESMAEPVEFEDGALFPGIKEIARLGALFGALSDEVVDLP